jgi:hypothetical protein
MDNVQKCVILMYHRHKPVVWRMLNHKLIGNWTIKKSVIIYTRLNFNVGTSVCHRRFMTSIIIPKLLVNWILFWAYFNWTYAVPKSKHIYPGIFFSNFGYVSYSMSCILQQTGCKRHVEGFFVVCKRQPLGDGTEYESSTSGHSTCRWVWCHFLYSKSWKSRQGHLVSRKQRGSEQQGLLCTSEWVVRAALRCRFKSNFTTLMHPCLHLSCQIFSPWLCSRPNFISLCSHLDRVPVLAGNKSVSSSSHYFQSSCGAYVSFPFRFWT